jgi:hypothetical protein
MRRMLGTDEDGEAVFIYTDEDYGLAGREPSARAAYLAAHGVDVPVELIEAYAEAQRVWSETQARLRAWVEEVAGPADSDERQLWEQVAFYQTHTWAQLERRPTCDHAEAISKLRDHGDRSANCEPCGAYVRWDTRRVIGEDGIATYERLDTITASH